MLARPYQTTTPGGAAGGGIHTHRYQGDAAATACGGLRGQLCKMIDGIGNTTSITYNASRYPLTITRPAPLGVTTNTFDAAGRIATSTDGKGQTATYARVDGSGTNTHNYDVQNRPTSKTIGGVTTSLTYDPASNITSFTDPSGTVNYRCDTSDRLTANGNQTKGGAPTSTWSTFDPLASHTNSNGVTTSHTYAGQANAERLTCGAMSFLNGSLGTTQQTNASGTTSFIRDPEGTLISMRNSAGASFYYTTDALGSTILLTDSAQAKAATYLYDSWGSTTTQTGTQATQPTAVRRRLQRRRLRLHQIRSPLLLPRLNSRVVGVAERIHEIGRTVAPWSNPKVRVCPSDMVQLPAVEGQGVDRYIRERSFRLWLSEDL